MEKKIEEAIRCIVHYFPKAEDLIKPTIFHSIRVWMYLYDNWYSEDICVAWILHDTLEDTDISEEEIEQNFWTNVLKIVKANTQNDALPKEERKDELIKRCAELSEDALIVKCADIIDNFWYWWRQNRDDEKERCLKLANLIKKYKLDSYEDIIFSKLFNLFA